MRNICEDNNHELKISADSNKLFDFDCGFDLYSFSNTSNLVPEVIEHYCFNEELVKGILAGFTYNRKTLVSGLHGSGKSSHIEQVAARLNWPVIRINLDAQIARSDLLGRDVIKLKDGMQITEFQEGLVSLAVRNGYALILDEFDAARPEILFVLQRLMEDNGKLTLLESGEVIEPHENFRIFATSNTLGSGDDLGIYHGVSYINQGMLDRFEQIIKSDYLGKDLEVRLLVKRFAKIKKDLIEDLVDLANLLRAAFKHGDMNQLITVRSLINILTNYEIYADLNYAINISYRNRLDHNELELFAELYQRIFAKDF